MFTVINKKLQILKTYLKTNSLFFPKSPRDKNDLDMHYIYTATLTLSVNTLTA